MCFCLFIKPGNKGSDIVLTCLTDVAITDNYVERNRDVMLASGNGSLFWHQSDRTLVLSLIQLCVKSESDSLQSDASLILHHLPSCKVGEEARMEKQSLSLSCWPHVSVCSSFFFFLNKTSFHILSNQDFSSSVDGNPTSLGHLLLVSHFSAENLTLRLLKDVAKEGEKDSKSSRGSQRCGQLV